MPPKKKVRQHSSRPQVTTKTACAPNRKQQKVIEHTEGSLLVIAGPGSGKIFTLVERTFYLISTKNLEPENLLIATFTEKAAKELITRISVRSYTVEF